MGINGLLPVLDPVKKPINLAQFKGKRIAIDGFVWLHRAAFRYAPQLAKDPSTPLLLPFLMTRINRLIGLGIYPVVVFDGQSLPSKLGTNLKRRADREESLAKAKYLESINSPEAFTYFARAISITSKTVYVWIKELQKNGVEYIVSPYEADAQLAYLARTGYVDAVITEDSDLVVYRCPITLFKMDDAMNVLSVEYNDALQLTGLSPDNFTAMGVLAGCDYGEHIGKLGIKTAIKMLQEYGNPKAVIDAAREKPKFTVPEDFDGIFYRSYTTFLCARAYDPRTESLVFLSPPPPDHVDFLGKALDQDLLLRLVKGKVDTITLEPLASLSPTGHKSRYFPNRTSESQSLDPEASLNTKKASIRTSESQPLNDFGPIILKSPKSTKKPPVHVKKSKSQHFKEYEANDTYPSPQRRLTSYFQLARPSPSK